jgi:hypothetical protein
MVWNISAIINSSVTFITLLSLTVTTVFFSLFYFERERYNGLLKLSYLNELDKEFFNGSNESNGSEIEEIKNYKRIIIAAYEDNLYMEDTELSESKKEEIEQ